MADEVQFEVSTSTVVRGLEKRTISKRESEGWELVSRDQGALRTELTFRRPKSKTSWKQLAILGAVVAVIVGAIAIGSSLSGDDEGEAATAGETPLASAPAAADAPDSTTDAPEPTPEPEASPAAPAVEPTPEPTLTPESNPDLAALLTGPDGGPSVEQFAETYAGQIIEFDGSIGAMAPHGDYETRYDILVTYGDFSETTSSGGPAFQFRDVNTTSDMHYVGDNIPDSIGVRDNIRVTARVVEFDSFRYLFYLEPVATRFR